MKKEYHLSEQPIPDDFQIFEDRLDIAGIQHRKIDAVKFISSKEQWLEFERDEKNKFDLNAIKVKGCTKGLFGTKKRFVGFVPSDVASRIVYFGIEECKPRLLKTYLGDSGFVEIKFQVIGPKGKKKDYQNS
jgi:hypothetical protein